MPYTDSGIFYPDRTTGNVGPGTFKDLADSIENILALGNVRAGATAGGWTGSITTQRVGRKIYLEGGVVPPLGHPTLDWVTCGYIHVDHPPAVTRFVAANTVFNSSITYSFRIRTDRYVDVRISSAITNGASLPFPEMSWNAPLTVGP